MGPVPVFEGLACALAEDLSHYTHINLAFANPGKNRWRNYSFRELSAGYAGAALLTDVIGSAVGNMGWEISQDNEDQLLIRTTNEATRNAAE
jgi:hypothetical protein